MISILTRNAVDSYSRADQDTSGENDEIHRVGDMTGERLDGHLVEHGLDHLHRAHVMLPQDMFPEAELLNISVAEVGNLVSRGPARRFFLRKLDPVDLVLDLQILERRISWNVTSPDTTRSLLSLDGEHRKWRIISKECAQGNHS